MKKKKTPAKHGTVTKYYTYKCRCARCTKAQREYMRGLRAELKTRTDIPHGTPNGYMNYGCRCEKCTAAKSKQKRELRTAAQAS